MRTVVLAIQDLLVSYQGGIADCFIGKHIEQAGTGREERATLALLNYGLEHLRARTKDITRRVGA